MRGSLSNEEIEELEPLLDSELSVLLRRAGNTPRNEMCRIHPDDLRSLILEVKRSREDKPK